MRTGDRPKAGTNSNCYIKLHGEDGNTSDSTALDVWWKNDFECGQEDHFHIKKCMTVRIQFSTVMLTSWLTYIYDIV